MERLCGSVSPEQLASKDPNCTNDMQAAIDSASNALKACFFMKKASSKVFGHLLKDLDNDFALGEDKCPKTMEEALDLLTACKQRNSCAKKHASTSADEMPENQDEGDTAEPELPFAQMEGKCCCCGKKGHRSNDCRDKNNILKEQ